MIPFFAPYRKYKDIQHIDRIGYHYGDLTCGHFYVSQNIKRNMCIMCGPKLLINRMIDMLKDLAK